MASLGLTVYEVAINTEIPVDGEDWHAMKDDRRMFVRPSLPSTRYKDLGTVLRQVSASLLYFVVTDSQCHENGGGGGGRNNELTRYRVQNIDEMTRRPTGRLLHRVRRRVE